MPYTRKRARDEMVIFLPHWPVDVGRIIFEYARRTEEDKMRCLLSDSGGKIKINVQAATYWIGYKSENIVYIFRNNSYIWNGPIDDILPSTTLFDGIRHKLYIKQMTRMLARY
jgi:hypothetical protein